MGYDENLCATVLENIRDGVYVVDAERRIVSWNAAAEGITGYSREQVRGNRCSDGILTHVDENGKNLCQEGCPLAATLSDGNVRNSRIYLHHAGGYRLPVAVRTIPLRDDDGAVIGAVEVFSHHSTLFAALRRVRELDEALDIDPLTGLASRHTIQGLLEKALERQPQGELRPGVLFLDVDQFKDILESYGRDVGDRVIEMVANTLQHNVRSTDHVGRWTGERFLMILQDVDEDRLGMMADKLRTLVSTSYLDLPDARLHVTVSLGATLTRPNDTVESLISRADSLLEVSKGAGSNRFTVAA